MDDFNQDIPEAQGNKPFPKRNPNAEKRRPELPADVCDRLDAKADSLGYGQKGRVKLLRVVLDVIDSMPALFRKR
jgi:hypothetical protein